MTNHPTPIEVRKSQFSPGAVRTATPFLVGALVSWGARNGLNINDDNAAYLIGAVGGYLFWAVVRFLEVFGSAKWGYVLGLGIAGSTPVYGVSSGEPGKVDDVPEGRIAPVGTVDPGLVGLLPMPPGPGVGNEDDTGPLR